MNVHRNILILPLFALLLAGCTREAFTRGPLPKLNDPDPAALRVDWAGRQPDAFVAENSFIIHIPFRDDLAFLGIVQVDRTAGTFEFVALTQTGVQLFHVNGDATGNHIRDAIEPLKKQKKILLSFAEDIRRIYLNLTPDRSAKSSVRSKVVRFKETSGDVRSCYDFGGDPIVLLEKRFKGFIFTNWRARYFDHVSSDAGIHPQGMLVKNGRYFYRITIKNRNFEPFDPAAESEN